MRVNRRDQKGAVAVIVALCALLIFGFAAYAIDSGHLWEERRQLVTTADAAALASANDYATGKSGCSTAASQFVTANHGGASMTQCNPVVASTTGGHVTVQAQATVEFAFAGIFGASNKDVRAATTAEWGLPLGVSNLRPFGLCINSNPLFNQWIAGGGSSDSSTIRITYGKAQPDACGDVPGNWGVQDFDGGANSNNDTKDWTLHGYPGLVSTGDSIPGDTGAFSNSLNSELNFLKTSGKAFALPVFDTATGNGSNAQFHIVAFVLVKLIDFKATGAEAARYMDLVFTKGVITGTCCGTGGIDTHVRAIRICDVNTLTPNTSDSRAC